ncbi:Isochorismatase hydrolase [Lactarius sanguifluus]|nr:Isochorismatase hydrolase [Lactarius sanguifluus]
MAASVVKLIPSRSVFLLCDVQLKFRTAIHGFDAVVATSNKLLRAAKIQEVPVIVTEQNPRALGKTDDRIDLASLGPLLLATVEKTLFSMATPEVLSLLEKHNFKSLVLMGVESHVCVLQSTLDLLERGYDVHVLADGVSSCNKEEIPVALERMRQAGAQITTSESLLFQLLGAYILHAPSLSMSNIKRVYRLGDASNPNFKAIANVIKAEKETTTQALQTLLPVRHAAL